MSNLDQQLVSLGMSYIKGSIVDILIKFKQRLHFYFQLIFGNRLTNQQITFSQPSEISGTETCPILDLPQEILLMIFKYLPTNERKAVKLVCKSWFEVCNLPSLSNDEVLYCRGFYKLSDIYKLLNQSERRLLNLKFQLVPFTNGSLLWRMIFTDDSSFWKINGPRIRSITFEDCQFEKNILREIIYFCENLCHLEFKSTRGSPLSLPNLVEVPSDAIVRANLQILEIDTSASPIPEDAVFQLFSLFSQLKVLKINCSYFHFDSRRIFPALNSYLMTLTDHIEKLELQFQYAVFPLNELGCFLEIVTSMKRLTELSINFQSKLPQKMLDEFIYSKPLKSLVYDRRSSDLDSLDSFLMQLLHSNLNLKHFKMKYPTELVVTKCLIEKLMSSNLKSCHLHIGGAISVEDPDSSGSWFSAEQRPKTLPSMRVFINCGDIPEQNVVSFLQCFPNIQYLHILHLSHHVLQSLFKYQRKLKSLVMVPYWPSDEADTGIDYFEHTFNELADMERLELLSTLTFVFLRSLLPKPALVNLKFLKIDLYHYGSGLNHDLEPALDLLKLADATPFLEAFYVTRSGRLPFLCVCTQLCSKLNRLRFLYWQENEKACFYSDKEYRTLFSICSSLRVLSHHQTFRLNKRINKYFFDSLKKKVTRVPEEMEECNLYTFANPKIGGYTVDWLEF